jgi:long-chain acyl-CoA synthetase
MDPTGVEPDDDWESLADLEKRGEANLEETKSKREEWGNAAKRDELATWTYTSGTTGPPKGVIQTNDNHLSMAEQVGVTGLFDDKLQEGGLFLFLPLAHSFGRLIEFAGPFFDAPIVISSVPTLADDLKSSRPGFFPAAPRVYEKVKSKVETKVAGAPPVRQKLFHWAIDTGKATIPYVTHGKPIPFLLGLQHALADKLVLSKLRAALGFDRCHVLLSGSAPLNRDVHEFFLACGLNLLEAYGLTETCPGLTANIPGAIRLGTVGRPISGVEIQIADDGEILAKGPNITTGYHNRPEATKDAFDDDGWFHTGDLGSMDEEGFVKITGRKKELMKTSGGKYIAPAKLEGALKTLPIVQEAVTVADTRNYVTALIALDPEELEEWAKQQGTEPDPQSEAVKAAVQAHVDECNEKLAKYETVKYFRIVEPMTVDNGLLTASLKVKRKEVYDRFGDVIDEMYESGRRAVS